MPSLRLILGVVLFAYACSSDGGPAPRSATLTGEVREDGSGAGVAGAKVTVGDVSATSDQSGRFELRDAPIGESIAIRVSATGFDTLTRSMAIRQGANTLSVSLVRWLWESAGMAIYIPRNVPLVRGVYLFLSGGTSDTSRDMRPFIRGELGSYQGISGVEAYRARFWESARTQAFAVMSAGLATLNDYPHDSFLQALNALAPLTGHDELRHAPLLPVGMSMGGCIAHELALTHPDRVIAFIGMKGGCHRPWDGLSAVPGYLFIGSRDEANRAEAITAAFEAYRANNAPWALAIEPQAAHTLVSDLDLLFHWLEDITALRLPATSPPGSPVALRPIDATSGWLGHRSSFQIAEDSAFKGDKLKAAWLPTARTATEWRAMMSQPR